MVINLLHHLDKHKSVGPDEIHPRVQRELMKMVTKPLSIIYQQPLLTREVQVDWKSANVTPICMRGCKDSGNYRTVCLTLVLGKVSEQLILSASKCRITRGLGPASMG